MLWAAFERIAGQSTQGCIGLQFAAGITLLLVSSSVRAAPNPLQYDAGPRAGVSINSDQWLLGGFGRVGGWFAHAGIGDVGLSLHELVGVGGNRLTFRSSLRLDSIKWWGITRSFGVYPLLGVGLQVLVPVGPFAEFCERTHLPGCGGAYWGAELGVGLRFRSAFLEASYGTGELPNGTVTLGLAFPLNERAP